MSKTGVILINIGSPDSPEPKAVGSYLKKFLMDKRVISLPFLLRWILVNIIIVPRRAVMSSRNYKKIWLKEENKSPLIYYSQKFAEQLQTALGENYIVRMGMQFSVPEIPSAMQELSELGCQSIKVVPMFPQYAEATSGSAIDTVRSLSLPTEIKLSMAPPFYQEFAEAQAQVALKSLYGKSFDHYLFSFHGLPEQQILKDPKCRLSEDCCVLSDGCARNCYRAQCFKTAEIIAGRLKLPKEKFSVSFQSRLGRARWIHPYTTEILSGLPAKGIRRVAVLSPSFVVDCLETLEEIGLNEKKNFLSSGGAEFHLVPCPNLNPEWVNIFADFVRDRF